MPEPVARVALSPAELGRVVFWRQTRVEPWLRLEARLRFVAAAADDAEPVSSAVREDLVQRCQAGDKVAFRELFRAHREDVARLVHRMLGQSEDLEDVVQEVFCQVHRSLRDFRSQARFSTWLYRVTVNVVLMHRRAARSRPVLVTGTDSLSLPAPDVPPDEQAARRSCVAAFRRLLDRLSEKKRTVFILHELEGLPPAEVASIVGAPVLTVRTRLFYARRELATMLQEEPMDVEGALGANSLAPAGIRR
jgi:RNA polymerase sigma-70 factor (ECF subfamily)